MNKRSTLDDGTEYEFSHHALQRLIEMEIAPHDAYLTLASPSDRVDSKSHPGAQNYRRGDLTLGVVTEPDGHLVVVTAVYSSGRAWRQAEIDGKLGEGREHRPGLALPGGGAA